MAKKRSSEESNPRLRLDYHEYMNMYNRRKKREEPKPAVDKRAQISEETAQAAPSSESPYPEYESAPVSVAPAPEATYQEERRAASEDDLGDALEPDDDYDDPDALDIQNPFMDMLNRAKRLTKKASEYIGTKKETDEADESETLHFSEEDDEDEYDDLAEDGESGWTRFLAKIGFKPLGDEDLDEDELKRKYMRLGMTPPVQDDGGETFHQSFEGKAGAPKFVEEIDPVFTMDSEYDEDVTPIRREPSIMTKRLDRTYKTQNDTHEEKLNVEGVDDMAGDLNKNETRYDDLLGYNASETPSMSRRERKSREAAGSATTTKKYPQAKPEPKIPVIADMRSVDEPTQEFKPIRARVDQRAVTEDYDDYDEPVRHEREIPAKQGKKKQRVYSDYDDEYKQDEYDDVYDDEYEDEYDEYDDYDYDEEVDDDRERRSIGRHILGFLKALCAIIIILIVLVIGLRLLENASLLSLDAVRDSVGKYLPIEVILPKPADNTDVPEATPLPEDGGNEFENDESGQQNEEEDFTDPDAFNSPLDQNDGADGSDGSDGTDGSDGSSDTDSVG